MFCGDRKSRNLKGGIWWSRKNSKNLVRMLILPHTTQKLHVNLATLFLFGMKIKIQTGHVFNFFKNS